MTLRGIFRQRLRSALMNAPREPFLEAGSPTFNLEDLKAPNPLLLMLEARAPWEYLAMLAAGPWMKQLPVGDGHPVMVFPGLAANDLTTQPLRSFLPERGYTAYEWEQGFNLGPRSGVLEGCCDMLRESDGFVDREGAVAIEPAPQRSAGDVRHHIEQPAVFRSGIVEREDVRVRQTGDRLDLAQEPLGPDGLGRFGLHDLERDPAAVFRVVREIHRRHSALTQGGEDGVRAEDHG